MGTIAYSISNGGQIVGEGNYAEDQVMHAIIWRNGIPQRLLGTLDGHPSSAKAINERGQIVGYLVNSKPRQVACIW